VGALNGESRISQWSVNLVVVVKDEDEPIRSGGDVIERGGQHGFCGRWLWGLEDTRDPGQSSAQSTAMPQ
jgi:hypothetical protein